MYAPIAVIVTLVSLATPSAARAAGGVDWLFSPISGAAEHSILASAAWHGRLMVFSWAILMPGAVVVARFFKITPRQLWPRQLDNPFWFLTHRRLGYLLVIVTAIGLGFILSGHRGNFAPWRSLHTSLGWLVVALAMFQLVGSLLRGTHGGPVNPFTRQPKPPEQWPGDHFSMSERRIFFEYTHKAFGYVLIPLAIAAIETGLRAADAPIWMWLVTAFWWLCCAVAFAALQRRVRCIDTYQAIWGLDRTLPGYRRRSIGIGVTRFTEADAAKAPWQQRGPE